MNYSELEYDAPKCKKRRSLQKSLAVAASVAVWHKPVVKGVMLPAHAQTSSVANEISVSSLDANNPFSRFVLIVDQNDSVLANCGASGGTASVNNLEPGTYRVFADSNGPQNQIFDISTGSSSANIIVPTNTGSCNFLVATIELPSGTITQESGQSVSAPWSCSTNQNIGCN